MAIYGNMVVPSKARGGALPTDNSDRTVYQPGSEVSARYSDAGGVLAAQAQGKEAEGLQGLARGIGQLPGAFVAIYDRQRRLEQARAQEYVTQMTNSYINEQNYLSKLRGADAVGANGKPDVMAHYAKWKESAINAMPKDLGEWGTRYAKMHLDTLLGRGEGWAQRYQDSQLDAYQESTIKASLQAKQDMMALSGGDPQQWAQAAGEGRAQIEMMGQRLGWSQEVIDQKVKEFETKGVQGLLGSCLANGDLNGALQAMNMYGPRMGAQEFAQAQASLNSTWKQMFGQACQDGNEAKMKELMDWAKSAKLRKPQARGGESGSLLRRYESTGLDDISIDTGGSKSYGPYQFNSGGGHSGGTMHRWVASTRTSDPEIYKRLSPYRVGSKEFDAAFKALAADPAMRERLSRSMRQGFLDMYENPALRAINGSEYAAKFAGNPVFREVMDSTAVQHGPGMVRNIFDKAWSRTDKTGSEQQILSSMISNIYQERQAPGRFKRAAREDPQIYAKMGKRYSSENAVAQRLLADYYRTGSMPQVQGLNVGAGGQPMSAQDKMAQRAAAGLPAEAPAGTGASAGAGGISPQGSAQHAQASGNGGDNIITAETLQGAEADYAPVGMATALWNQISKLETQAEREEAVTTALAKIENPVQQQRVEGVLRHKLRISADQEKAADSAKAQEIMPMLKDMGREEARARLQSLVDGGTITPAQAARAFDRTFEEPKDNVQTRAAKNRILYLIDDNKVVSLEQLEYLCKDQGLTNTQTHDCIKWLEVGGSAGKAKKDKLDYIKRQYFWLIENKKLTPAELKYKEIPDGFLGVMLSLLKKGREATEEDLDEAIIKAGWEAKGLFNSERYYQYVNQKGNSEFFHMKRDRISKDEIQSVEKEARLRLKKLGHADPSGDMLESMMDVVLMENRGMAHVERDSMFKRPGVK